MKRILGLLAALAGFLVTITPPLLFPPRSFPEGAAGLGWMCFMACGIMLMGYGTALAMGEKL